MGTPQNLYTYKPGRHFVRPIPFKAHKIDGYSPELLERHYENVYGGSIRSLNEVEQKIASLSRDKLGKADHIALKSREQRLANEISLHENYFNSLGEDGGEALDACRLAESIEASFGSIAHWRKEFTALALSASNGWVILVWSKRLGRLLNVCLNGAAQGMVSSQAILALDTSNYAYRLDFGSDRRAYIDAFINSIHWGHVSDHFSQAVIAQQKHTDSPTTQEQISVEELKGLVERGNDKITVLDVRHDDDRERYRSRIMHTDFRDSFDVKSWVHQVSKNKPVVVYCMYGFWVSQKVAEDLRDEGVDARSLIGGITAWRAMGLSCSENKYTSIKEK